MVYVLKNTSSFYRFIKLYAKKWIVKNGFIKEAVNFQSTHK